ncbi:maltooligosyl trehalose synthase [Leifsonia sp. Root1293]|nr:maltooligosyl trehalose synthase [Leifsonia sp. Root1293]KRA12828.1 maltooligosyl trehalose synthase [Leifsonia sp. Root60]
MPQARRLPRSTYRLQITPGFTLDDAASVVDYVRDLGADWIYLSPLLAAEDGSDHGYDVTDHALVDPARGGGAALDRLAAAARARGLGVLIDIVPNHVGVATPSANVWWWDVLAHGRESRYAEAFDVDWDAADGRLVLPVLRSDGDDELAAMSIDVDAAELVYYDHRFPLAPGSLDGLPDTGGDAGVAAIRAILDRQHYALVDWRRADAELNYRRFFAVNSLAGIRVEIPWVFEQSHREIGRWVREGLADGLRVDHPDGLADPGRYLADLARLTDGAPVWVEKILEGDESMPPEWATVGTTGYDALAQVDRLFVDPAGRHQLERATAALDPTAASASPSWPDLIHGTKRAIADGILHAEVLRLARLLPELEAAGFDLDARADALGELLACFPVYRSYLPFGAGHLDEARAEASRRRPDIGAALDAVAAVLADPRHPAAVRFQQTSGMVMAKGVEDTAFYRYTRLTSLTEVGADPSEFSIDPVEFHSRQVVRQAAYPLTLTTLSTHDTKRGEDVRARISVLSEWADGWTQALAELHERLPLGDVAFENLLWQAVVGSWPASRERLQAYAEKAAREAGTSTTWTAPDAAFEARVHAAVDAVFDDDDVAAVVQGVVDAVTAAGFTNGLGAKLVQLTAPGVPDVYQGSELWELSLVDPDNRRPVDAGMRRDLLARLDDGWLPSVDDSGAAKLLVTSRALRLRRDHPELFTRYLGLPAYGPAADHVVAFDRGGAIAVATRLPVGLAAAGGWNGTVLRLPEDVLVDVISGREWSGEVLLAELLADYPVALLAPRSVQSSGDRAVR